MEGKRVAIDESVFRERPEPVFKLVRKVVSFDPDQDAGDVLAAETALRGLLYENTPFFAFWQCFDGFPKLFGGTVGEPSGIAYHLDGGELGEGRIGERGAVIGEGLEYLGIGLAGDLAEEGAFGLESLEEDKSLASGEESRPEDAFKEALIGTEIAPSEKRIRIDEDDRRDRRIGEMIEERGDADQDIRFVSQSAFDESAALGPGIEGGPVDAGDAGVGEGLADLALDPLGAEADLAEADMSAAGTAREERRLVGAGGAGVGAGFLGMQRRLAFGAAEDILAAFAERDLRIAGLIDDDDDLLLAAEC